MVKRFTINGNLYPTELSEAWKRDDMETRFELWQCPVALLALSALFAGWLLSPYAMARSQRETQTSTEEALKSLAAIRPIDVHVHVFKTDPAFQALLERLQLTL